MPTNALNTLKKKSPFASGVALGVMVGVILTLGSCGIWSLLRFRISNDPDRFSYSLGHQMGTNFKNQGLEFDPGLFARGLQDSMRNRKPSLNQNEMRLALRSMGSQSQTSDVDALKDPRKLSEDFLRQNKNRPGIQSTESGLQYKLIARPGQRKLLGDEVLALRTEVRSNDTKKVLHRQRFEIEAHRLPNGIQQVLRALGGTGEVIIFPSPLENLGPLSVSNPTGDVLVYSITVVSITPVDANAARKSNRPAPTRRN